jgi:serine/threonine protein kinase
MADEAARSKGAIRPKVIGRYALFGEIASGGMATVHFARLVGPVGFSRTVAIKRLHPQYAKDPEFVAMFLDEARLASRVQHPNVVTTLDVVNMPNEVFLVMEYVAGESLSKLVKNAKKEDVRIPPSHVAGIIAGMLHGLHAAHEAKSERREPLNIVHRDVSPQNVLVGVDGVARVLDFGVAKAAMRAQSTRDGQMKGKLSYMSPEQLNGRGVDRRTDLFAAGVVLWEALTGKRLFDGSDAGEIFAKVVAAEIPEPKTITENIPDALNAVVMKALERNPDKRYQTAREFAIDLESSIPVATGRTVGEWVERFAGPDLERRLALVADIESVSTSPEDLAKIEKEDGAAPLPELPEQSVSTVQPVSGSRPRIPPPPPRAPPPAPSPIKQRREPEEHSSGSLSSAGSSTSQVSSLAVPNPMSVAASRGGASMWIGAIAACVGGGALAFYVFWPEEGGHSAGVAPSAPSGITSGAPAAVAPSSPGKAYVTPPTETVDIQDLPSAPPDVEENGVPGAAPRWTGGARRAPKAAPSAKPVDNCNPPFTVDATGIKRLKPGCL